MRNPIHAITLLLLALLIAGCDTTGHAATKPGLIIVGTVLKVGPSPERDSGGVEVYQLIRYRVNRVCKGQYKGEEIIVDHLILRSDELRGLKVGDKVCVAISPQRQLSPRYDDGEIRQTTDVVQTYYVGTLLKETKSSSCACR